MFAEMNRKLLKPMIETQKIYIHDPRQTQEHYHSWDEAHHDSS